MIKKSGVLLLLSFFQALTSLAQIGPMQVDSIFHENKNDSVRGSASLNSSDTTISKNRSTSDSLIRNHSLIVSDSARSNAKNSSFDTLQLPSQKMKNKIENGVSQELYIPHKTKENWMTFLLLFILFYFVFLRVQYDKKLVAIFQAYWNERIINQFIREDNAFKLRTSVSLFIFFAMVFALLFYYMSVYFNSNISIQGLYRYFVFFGIISIFYSLKYIMLKITSYFFAFQRMMLSYLAILSVSNLTFTIIVLPVFILYPYIPPHLTPYLLFFVLGLFGLNSLYKYIRSGLYVISNFQFPKFYLFIYLCTLEIAPILVAIRFIKSY